MKFSSEGLNMEKLSRIAAKVAAHFVEEAAPEMELVFMGINFPTGMTPDEALQQARLLIPFQTGAWELEQHEQGRNGGQWMVGNLECAEGFYDQHPEGFRAESGGVRVEFETP